MTRMCKARTGRNAEGEGDTKANRADDSCPQWAERVGLVILLAVRAGFVVPPIGHPKPMPQKTLGCSKLG